MDSITRKKPVGGSGDYRDEELGLIHEHVQQWASTPPPSSEHLKYLDTYLLGDLNQGLNNFNKVYGISHGKKDKGVLGPRVAGQVKYQGQNQLMHDFSVHLADNFVDCRTHERQAEKIVESTDTDKRADEPDTEKRVNKTDAVKSEHLKTVKNEIIKQMVNKLKSKPEFSDISPERLELELKERFLVYTGSIINETRLLHSIDGNTEDQEESLDNDCEHEKYVDACFSADFDRPDKLKDRGLYALDRRCMIFSPQGKNKSVYTDHAGVTGEFTYTTRSP
jgi:hypothetical protein